MTDYKEEQRNELEALESIYPEEFTLLTEEPCASFKLTIFSENYQDEIDNAVSCTIFFTYVEKYPDEPPLTEIRLPENLDDNDIIEMQKILQMQAEENLGTVMIFTLVSIVQERLNEKVDEMKKRKEEEKERLLREKEEAETRRLVGTRVTIESFLAWKAKFDAEIAELKQQDSKIDIAKKLTGRELFEKDSTLNESDMKFLQEAGDVVDVDESLFQDLDDLELEDEVESGAVNSD